MPLQKDSYSGYEQTESDLNKTQVSNIFTETIRKKVFILRLTFWLNKLIRTYLALNLNGELLSIE